MADEQALFAAFEWNPLKRETNYVKHKIDFEAAAVALDGPRLEKPSVHKGEHRILAICPMNERLIAVVYTMRGDTCRIISARAARKNEQRDYRQIYP